MPFIMKESTYDITSGLHDKYTWPFNSDNGPSEIFWCTVL